MELQEDRRGSREDREDGEGEGEKDLKCEKSQRSFIMQSATRQTHRV
jgi:hypothetical protein